MALFSYLPDSDDDWIDECGTPEERADLQRRRTARVAPPRCERCGEFCTATDQGEFYDPAQPEVPSWFGHPGCRRPGEEIA